MKGLYVYGIIHHQDAEILPKIYGVDFASPVYTIPFQKLEAVVGDINNKKINPIALKKRMGEDDEWLKKNVILHHKVIDILHKNHPIVPLKFGTIFKSNKNLEEELSKIHKKLDNLLFKLTDKHEWSLKVFLDKEKIISKLILRNPTHKKRKAPSDIAWYKEKKEEQQVKENLGHSINDILEKIVLRLKKITKDIALLDSMRHSETGKKQLIFNGALLLSEKSLSHLKREIKKISQKYKDLGIRLDINGPWPPYNFVN